MLGEFSTLSYTPTQGSDSPPSLRCRPEAVRGSVPRSFGGSDRKLHILAFSFMGKKPWRSDIDSACLPVKWKYNMCMQRTLED